MSERRLSLDRLDRADVSEGGRRASFRILGDSGESVDVECGHADLPPMIRYLTGLGRNAAAARQDVTPQSFGHSDKVSVEPIETSDIGLMRDIDSSELVLVARMFGFDLGFTVTPHRLAALYREIERAVPKSILAPGDHHDHHHGHDHHGHDHEH